MRVSFMRELYGLLYDELELNELNDKFSLKIIFLRLQEED